MNVREYALSSFFFSRREKPFEFVFLKEVVLTRSMDTKSINKFDYGTSIARSFTKC